MPKTETKVAQEKRLIVVQNEEQGQEASRVAELAIITLQNLIHDGEYAKKLLPSARFSV